MALCVGVMTLCATSSLFVSCDKYDDTALKNEIESLKGQVTGLDGRIKTLEALTAKVDALYTLQFKVSADNELQYSFDGKNWTDTGVILAEDCDDPAVSLDDKGDRVVITVGDDSFTIEKPKEIEFEIKAGKLFFNSKETKKVAVITAGIDDLSVLSAPKGWDASVDKNNYLVITAPATEDLYIYDSYWEEVLQDGTADETGYIKVHACSEDGKCIVGKINVAAIHENTSAVIIELSTKDVSFTISAMGMYYYGVSLAENYEADVDALFATLADPETADQPEYSNVSKKVADVLGSAPEAGKEYVIWAAPVTMNYMAGTITLPAKDEIVKVYYTPIEANVTDLKTTAYGVELTLNVVGAKSYYAYPFIPSEWASLDVGLEEMVMSYQMGRPQGMLLDGEYKGSIFALTSGQGAMSEAKPDSKVYLFILPVGTVPSEMLTVDDVIVKEFTTNPVLAGSDLVTTVVQDMENTTYTKLVANITVDKDSWKYIYYQWMTDEELAGYKEGETLIVEDIVDDMLKSDRLNNVVNDENFSPVFHQRYLNPGDSRTLVAFAVDNNDKRSEVVITKMTTYKPEWSTMEFTATSADVVEGVVTNKSSVKISLTTSSGQVTKSKYLLRTYDQYKSYDALALAEEILYEENYSPITDGAELVVDELEVDETYYIYIIAYDENGNPSNKPVVVTFTTKFVLPGLEDVPVKDPEVTFNMPEMSTEDTVAEYEYYVCDSGYGIFFYFDASYTIKAEEGVELRAFFADDPTQYADYTDIELAEALWSNTLGGGYGTRTAPGTYDKSTNLMYGEEEMFAPVVYVSWTVDGKYYFKTYDFGTYYNTMYENLVASLTK